MSSEQTRPESGYSDVDQTVDPRAYVSRLDAVGATDFWRSVKHRTFALMAPRPGERVLDVGCGTGDDVRALAELVQPGGMAVGVDASETMIREARARASTAGLPVEFRQASAESLPFSAATFDAVRIERVLQHVAEPRAAIAEMARVARSGARLVGVEPDYGTLSILGGDASTTRAIVESRVAHFASGRVGRDLRRMFSELGLSEAGITVAPVTSADWEQDAASGMLEKYALDAEAGSYIQSNQRVAWLEQLRQAADAGRYRHTLMVYIVAAIKP
ncbi:MAG: class I SAM-dependent methyltransferase [Chloroflexota bacterium]